MPHWLQWVKGYVSKTWSLYISRLKTDFPLKCRDYAYFPTYMYLFIACCVPSFTLTHSITWTIAICADWTTPWCYLQLSWHQLDTRPSANIMPRLWNIEELRKFTEKYVNTVATHDDVINWKHFPRYWPFVWGIHWSPVNSPHKGHWRGALMFSLIWAFINA